MKINLGYPKAGTIHGNIFNWRSSNEVAHFGSLRI
jgi:hypothetical protein